jgi:hypothetical protein
VSWEVCLGFCCVHGGWVGLALSDVRPRALVPVLGKLGV